MSYVLNGPLKEYRKKRRRDKMRTKLTETTLLTQMRQSIKTRCNGTYISFEAIVSKLTLRYYHTLAAGLHQVTQLKMGIILQVTEG